MKRSGLFGFTATLLMLIFVLSACSKEQTDTVSENLENSETISEGTTYLTNVFSEEELVLPDGLEVSHFIVPDCSDGKFRIHATKEVSGEDGDLTKEHYLCEFGEDADVTVKSLDFIKDMESFNIGLLSGDSLIILDSTYNNDTGVSEYNLYRYNLSSGACDVCEDVQSYLPEFDVGRKSIKFIAADSDGYIYLTDGIALCVLNPDLSKSFDYVSDDSVENLATSNDGDVYMITSFGIKKFDRDLRKPSESLTLPEGVEAENCYFGLGYDVYYADEEGLYGHNDGMTEDDIIVNWDNSCINYSKYAPLTIMSPEIMLYLRSSKVGEEIISILKKASDIDISDVAIVEVAGTYLEDAILKKKVLEYNRKNKDIRVIVNDYAQYNLLSNETYDQGTPMLINGMLTETHTPDIIIDINNGKIMNAVLENDLYADLYEFIDADEDISREDIVGCVKNTYEVDGKLSAIPPYFKLQTFVAPKSLVGDRESWGIEEMLDVEAGLDDGVMLTNELDSWFRYASPYLSFVDLENGVCDFDNETFIKLMDYIVKTEKQIQKQNAELALSPKKKSRNKYEDFQNGKYALYNMTYAHMEEYMCGALPFRTDDYSIIGFPMPDNYSSGNVIDAKTNAWLITKNAPHKEEAWDFIKFILMDYDDSGFYNMAGIRTLKSQNDVMREMLQDKVYYYTYDGQIEYGDSRYVEYIEKNGIKESRPGIIVGYNEAEFYKFVEMLDNSGFPLVKRLPKEVQDIIDEEISVYASGVRDAGQTAKVIESRVSIWLSEHK